MVNVFFLGGGEIVGVSFHHQEFLKCIEISIAYPWYRAQSVCSIFCGVL